MRRADTLPISEKKLSLPEATWPASSGIVQSLDGVRAVSVLIVLIGHLMLPVSLVGISALGLKIFFFLSGFLITRLLFAEAKTYGRIALGHFYFRRLLRLYPVILVYLAVCAAVAAARRQPIDPLDVASVFLYFVNYRVIYYEHVGGAFTLPVPMLWSLSIEEHFYLLAPLALVLLSARARLMLLVAGGICVVSLALRLFYAHSQPGIVDTLELYWRSETRFDCIAFGVALSCLTEFSKGRQIIAHLASRRAFIAGVLLLLASFSIRDNYFQNTWRFTVQGLALFPIISGVVFGEPFPRINALLNTRALVWIGALSYSLYVWHGSVDFLFAEWIDQMPAAVQSSTHVAATFALATLSYYLVEMPVMKLRRRFVKSKRLGGKHAVNPAI